MTTNQLKTENGKNEIAEKLEHDAALRSATLHVQGWKPGQVVHQALKDAAPAALQAHAFRMAPATPAEIAVELEKTAAMFDRSGGDFIADNADTYFDALATVPAPLLRRAFSQIRRSHKIAAMPLPGEIIDQIDKEWGKWAFEGQRIKSAARQANVTPPTRSAPRRTDNNRHTGERSLGDVLKMAATA